MTILGTERLVIFKAKHPDSRKALARWETVIRASSWHSLVDLKGVFRSADYVDGHTVFNIGGNRLITVVQYEVGFVVIRQALTHEEYDKGGWKK